MQDIIDKVDVDLIKKELNADTFLRHTNRGGNEIYVVNSHNAPNTMREIGRLREIAFRDAGGGTGLECDIDEFDTMDPPCQQMIVWDPEGEEIIGGYRFILGENIAIVDGVPRIATSHLFHFSPKFVSDILPHTLELGRSFVVPTYQNTGQRPKNIYALDNLWDGLGALTVKYPQIKYLFGKVTMYPDYDAETRDILLGFMHRVFPDPDQYMTPIHPMPSRALDPEIQGLFTADTLRENYMTLNKLVRQRGQKIPPLVNAYMSLSPTMRMFGTAVNDEFGDVYESGILITVDEIHQEKKDRHILTYSPEEINKSGSRASANA